MTLKLLCKIKDY